MDSPTNINIKIHLPVANKLQLPSTVLSQYKGL